MCRKHYTFQETVPFIERRTEMNDAGIQNKRFTWIQDWLRLYFPSDKISILHGEQKDNNFDSLCVVLEENRRGNIHSNTDDLKLLNSDISDVRFVQLATNIATDWAISFDKALHIEKIRTSVFLTPIYT